MAIADYLILIPQGADTPVRLDFSSSPTSLVPIEQGTQTTDIGHMQIREDLNGEVIGTLTPKRFTFYPKTDTEPEHAIVVFRGEDTLGWKLSALTQEIAIDPDGEAVMPMQLLFGTLNVTDAQGNDRPYSGRGVFQFGMICSLTRAAPPVGT